MKRFWLLLAVALASMPVLVGAQEPPADSVSPGPVGVRVGEPFTLILQVAAAQGVAVEVDTAATGWGDVEVIDIRESGSEPLAGGYVRHTFQVRAAATRTGRLQFVPSVFLVDQGEYSRRDLPGSEATVASVLAPGDPLELSPLAEPRSVSGAQSPWLVPAVALAAVLAVLAIVAGLFFAARWLARRPRPQPELEAGPEPLVDIDSLVGSAGSDAVALYRAMSGLVRSAIGTRYEFPARAMTTVELQRRMDALGVDRWQSRLVGGLLEQCDAVVYAGYRPAPERREADIAVAREVLQEAG